MTTELQPITRTRLAKVLGEQTLARLAPHLRARAFHSGQLLALEGAPGEEVWLITRGLAAMRQVSPEGREHVLAYLGPGSLFGLAAAFDGGAHPAGVEALTDGDACVLTREQLLGLVQQHPDLALALARQMAAEIRRLSGMVKDLALHPVRARLARFLLDHAEEAEPRARWTQKEIAHSIGTVRDVVGRALRAFIDDGLVRREGGRLVIVDRAGLERETDVR